MKYSIEQEQGNKRFISKNSWKDKIKRSQFLKIFVYFCNNCDGLHTFLRDSTALLGVGLLIVEMSRSHFDTLRKIGTLWTRDRPVEETPALQNTHKTLTRDRQSHSGVRNCNPCRQTATDPHLRPCGPWDQRVKY